MPPRPDWAVYIYFMMQSQTRGALVGVTADTAPHMTSRSGGLARLAAPAKPDGAESEVFQLSSELDALLVWVARIEPCAEQAQAVDISRHAPIISFTWCAQPGALGRARHVFASPCD